MFNYYSTWHSDQTFFSQNMQIKQGAKLVKQKPAKTLILSQKKQRWLPHVHIFTDFQDFPGFVTTFQPRITRTHMAHVRCRKHRYEGVTVSNYQ